MDQLKSIRLLAEGGGDVERELDELGAERAELLRLKENPSLALRTSLYQRLAGWLRSQPGTEIDFDSCPVCRRTLNDVVDPATELLVVDHIRQHLENNKPFLEKTLEDWQDAACDRILSRMPPGVCSAVKTGGNIDPVQLFKGALGTEFFEEAELGEVLAPLKEWVEGRFEAVFNNLPSMAVEIGRSATTTEVTSTFERYMAGARRLVQVSKWLGANRHRLGVLVVEVVGKVDLDEDESSGESRRDSSTLAGRVLLLRDLVDSTKPVEDAVSSAQKMLDHCHQHREIEKRIELYGEAIDALGPLMNLDEVVDSQLANLISLLNEETINWKGRLYRPAVVDAPEFHRSEVDPKGTIAIYSSFNRTTVESSHIANSSDLRATLIAFLISLTVHVLSERGGVSLMILDDPQELFDSYNRRHVADSIPQLLTSGLQVVVTTNDPSFRNQLAQGMREYSPGGILTQLEMRPHHAALPVGALTPLYEECEKYRKEFEKDSNREDDEVARAYAKSVREFAETAMLECLGVASLNISSGTLRNLLQIIKPQVGVSERPFSGKSWRTLFKEFPSTGANGVLALLNKSHHGQLPKLTFREVHDKETSIKRFVSLIKEARYETSCWFRRDVVTPEVAAEVPEAPCPSKLELPSLRVVSELAAFSSGSAVSMLEDMGEIDSDRLRGNSLYLLNTDNFGFAGAPGHLAVVESNDQQIEDGRLVIALYKNKIFARRLLTFGGDRSVIALGSEAEDPRARRQSLILPAMEVRLLKVVGILFEDQEPNLVERQEATFVDRSDLLQRAKLGFRVRGDSALPLALKGQLVLGGQTLSCEQLGENEGRIVAVSMDQEAYLKKVGPALGSDGNYRIFEPIGAYGSSVIGRWTDETDILSGSELVSAVRLVLGVLYESSAR